MLTSACAILQDGSGAATADLKAMSAAAEAAADIANKEQRNTAASDEKLAAAEQGAPGALQA